MAIKTSTSTKLISNVLYTSQINWSLLNVGQMLENDYFLNFQDKSHIIYDQLGYKILIMKMRIKALL